MVWFYRILTIAVTTLYYFECIGFLKFIGCLILISLWVLISQNPFPVGPEVYHGVNGLHFELEEIASNDGLTLQDFKDWFKYPTAFDGQIICFKDPKY